MTGATHADHRSARSPRQTLEGPAGDNPIAGPRTGTTRSEASAHASAGASGRHNEPGSRPASACRAQPPSKSGDASPRLGKGTTSSGKRTGAPRGTGLDKARRTTQGHKVRQRCTPPATTKAHGQVPSNNGHRVPQTRTARTTRNKPQHANRCQPTPAAVGIDVSAPGSEPSPCRLLNGRRPDGRVRARKRDRPLPATKQVPSGWTCARPEGTQPLPAT